MERLYVKAHIILGTEQRVFRIVSQNYLLVDGEEVRIGESTTLTVEPGQFDMVKEFAPNLLDIFKALWTKSVVTKWKHDNGSISNETDFGKSF